MRNINKTVWELLFGILVSGLILEIIGVMLVRDKLYYSAGVGIGVILAVFMTFSISSSVEQAVDRGEGGARAKMISSYAVRTGVVLAVLILASVFRWGHPVGLLLGIMTLKVAAYLQPVTHKIFSGGKS